MKKPKRQKRDLSLADRLALDESRELARLREALLQLFRMATSYKTKGWLLSNDRVRIICLDALEGK